VCLHILPSVLDQSSYLKAKINNTGVLALAYSQALRPGVRATFGLAVDTQKLNDVSPSGPAHKVNSFDRSCW
jgi:voltage-dependent anion channel protein 2